MPACMSPFHLIDKIKNESFGVPCGKCPNCKARRIGGWAFRLTEQLKTATSSNFITLTYAIEHIPILENGQTTINKRDPQLFFKRLRKANPDTKIKYYLAAEYGDKTDRPHYHIILFNAQLDTIQKAWDLGNIHYGDAGPASITYTLKYINKTIKIPKFDGDLRIPEFQLISKGLGATYINEKTTKWHSKNIENRYYLPLQDGKKIALPRYYKDKLYTDEQKKQISFHTQIKQAKIQPETDPKKIQQKITSDKHKFKLMQIKCSKNDKL
ncbi:replication initiation protein [Antarctic microvirus CAA_003_V_1]|nr:replication initiation protein [Antarctic microvirus CAA_003_V_1]